MESAYLILFLIGAAVAFVASVGLGIIALVALRVLFNAILP